MVSLRWIVVDPETLSLLAGSSLFDEFVVSNDPGCDISGNTVVSNHAFWWLLFVQIRQLQILNLHLLLEFELFFLFLIELFWEHYFLFSWSIQDIKVVFFVVAQAALIDIIALN